VQVALTPNVALQSMARGLLIICLCAIGRLHAIGKLPHGGINSHGNVGPDIFAIV